MSTLKFDPENSVSLVCLCYGTVVAGLTSENDMAVIHSEPPCQKFVELEPDDFFYWLSARLQGKVN